MFKKLLTAAMITSMLILPVSSVGPAGHEGASLPVQTQDYLPGDLPAQTGAVESMSPVLHAMLLAMLNQERDSFDLGDSALAWEGLYNMLSLYGLRAVHHRLNFKLQASAFRPTGGELNVLPA